MYHHDLKRLHTQNQPNSIQYYGLFLENGTPVTLSNANAVRDGYYEGDVINIDHVPRPEMETIWDTYSPDGYYPLEDPKVPGV